MLHHGCVYEIFFIISVATIIISLISIVSFSVFVFFEITKPVDPGVRKCLDKVREEEQKIREIEKGTDNVVSITRRSEAKANKG